MPCPSCGSHDLWDDDYNPIWGCNKCHWFGDQRNAYSERDKFNCLPASEPAETPDAT